MCPANQIAACEGWLMRYGKRWGVALLAVALVALMPTALVQGSNVGSNTASGGTGAHACDNTPASQCVANNGSHEIIDSGLSAGSGSGSWKTSMNAAVTLYNGNADVSVFWGSPVNGYDVSAVNANYGQNGRWGWTECADPVNGVVYGGTDPDRWCRPQFLDFNDFYSQTSSQKNVITCHELGHTLGLRHSNETSGSCMKKDQRTINGITTHDHAMLNGQY